MTHIEAVGTLAAERYVLGEMNEGEHAVFEEHFFGCPECAEAVRLGTLFIVNLRALLRDEEA